MEGLCHIISVIGLKRPNTAKDGGDGGGSGGGSGSRGGGGGDECIASSSGKP